MRKSRFTVHILATDRRTDGQTHKQMDNPNTLSCLRYCEWWLNKAKTKTNAWNVSIKNLESRHQTYQYMYLACHYVDTQSCHHYQLLF